MPKSIKFCLEMKNNNYCVLFCLALINNNGRQSFKIFSDNKEKSGELNGPLRNHLN